MVGVRSFDGLSARRIALDGEPALSPVVLLQPGSETYSPVIASDGNDYLVAWSEGFRFCGFECFFPPFKLLALRLRPDATQQ